MIAVLVFLQSDSFFAQNKSNEKTPSLPQLLSQREQLKVREEWLKKRFDTMLLPMMRKHNVAMWIVTNEEFQPDLRVQRQAKTNSTSQQFLSTAEESVMLESGDLIHIDFGLNYMGLSTDWQKHAYILKTEKI